MSDQLIIVADAHIWGVAEAFNHLEGYEVDLRIMEKGAIDRHAVADADILLTRSSTRVDAELLQDSRVRFAATATIGDDHYDKQWLDSNGIAWANAAGSSTGSVIEYMATSLLWLQQQGRIEIPATTIGIVGVGRIGSALSALCSRLGMRVLHNDPPRARSEGGAGFDSLECLLDECDIISLHTPMIREGEDCTHHLLGSAQLNAFSGNIIFNAARGGCIDNHALLAWLDSDSDHMAALDCWEFEPSPLQPLIAHPGMVIATPHIAGHSLDGKAANTLYTYRALCDHLGISPCWNFDAALPPSPIPHTIDAEGDVWHQLWQAANWLYRIERDHETMKGMAVVTALELPNAFSGYRRHYPERRAWHCAPIHFRPENPAVSKLAETFGMKIV